MTPDTIQHELAQRFRSLHAGERPLQLANAWDANSARVLAASGAPAIGTTSFGVALNRGKMDGNVAFAQVLEVATAIVASVDVPVTVDMEAGHGSTPAEVGESVDRIIACGAVGINLEDGVPSHTGELFATSDQSARIAAARGAAERSGVPIFINARCDVYFGAQIDADARRDEALSRSKSYQDAGADGLFLPGLLDTETIRSLTAEIELPLNIMIGTGAPSYADLSAAGVRRVSQGGEPFLALVGFLKSITERYLAGDMSPSPAGDLGVGVTLLSALAG